MIEHLHQLAVHAYYAGELDVGRRACERLLALDLTPEKERVVRNNRTWYTQRLDAISDCQLWRLAGEPAQPGWTRFNPTICSVPEGGFRAIIRSSNYRCIDGRYIMPECDAGRIRTENLLISLDEHLEQVGEQVQLTTDYERSGFPVDGIEDCRLNFVDGSLRVSGTCRNASGRDGLARIATATLDEGGVLQPVVLDEPFAGRHEKNWMPLVGTNEWLYACNEAGRVATVSEHDGRWVLRPRGHSCALARGFRGGTQLVPCEDGWLACIHEVADENCRRTYEHRFVWFGPDLAIVGWSMPFVFCDRRQIEFAAGLAWTKFGRLVCTFGVRDEEAWAAKIDYQSLVARRITP